MENKCLITKLENTVEDSSLRKLDEIAIRCKNTSDSHYAFKFCLTEDFQLRIIGSGSVVYKSITYQAPITLTISQNETTWINLQPGFDGIVFVPRYTNTDCYYVGSINVEDLLYSPQKDLILYCTVQNTDGTWISAYGNLDKITNKYDTIYIDNVESATKLADEGVYATDALKLLNTPTDLDNLPRVMIRGNNIGAKLSSLPAGGYKNITLLGLNISGNLSSLTNCWFEGTVALGRSKKITGDVTNIKLGDAGNAPQWVDLTLKSCPNVYGNLAKIEDAFCFITTCPIYADTNDELLGDTSYPTFTWDGNRSRGWVLAMEKVKFATAADVDRMLIAQAANAITLDENGVKLPNKDNIAYWLQVDANGVIINPISYHNTWQADLYHKTIEIYGSRTSASDEAIADLNLAGFTIIISGITQ